MKTTVELPAPLLHQLKRVAAEQGVAMRELFLQAVQLLLAQSRTQLRKPFKWKPQTFKGNGLCPGIEDGDWETIRHLAYEGRGG